MPNIKNQEIVKSLKEKFKVMKGLILTEYRGLTVKEISDLRLRLRPFVSEYSVAKNTLSKIAFKEIGLEAGDFFSGSTALVIENGASCISCKSRCRICKSTRKSEDQSRFF